MSKVILGAIRGAFFGTIGAVACAVIALGIIGVISYGYQGFILGIFGALYYTGVFGLYCGLAPGMAVGRSSVPLRLLET